MTRTPDAVALANRELAAMGTVSTKEIIMALIFVGLIAMWVFGDVIDIDATLAAAIGVAVMLVTGVLTWKDALAERAAWDTMVWIGILIMLAAKLNEYGLIAWLGKALGLYLQGYHRLLLFLLVGAVYFFRTTSSRAPPPTSARCTRSRSPCASRAVSDRFPPPSRWLA